MVYTQTAIDGDLQTGHHDLLSCHNDKTYQVVWIQDIQVEGNGLCCLILDTLHLCSLDPSNELGSLDMRLKAVKIANLGQLIVTLAQCRLIERFMHDVPGGWTANIALMLVAPVI